MFKNMSVRKRLLLGYGVTIAISLTIIVACMVMMSNQKNAYGSLLDQDAAANEQILYVRVHSILAGRGIRDALLVPDSEANSKLIADSENALNLAKEYLEMLKTSFPKHIEDRSLLQEYESIYINYSGMAEKLIEMYNSYDRTKNTAYLEQAADYIYTTVTPEEARMAEAAEKLDDQLVIGVADQRERITQNLTVSTIVLIAATAVATVLVIVLGVAIVKDIMVSIEQVRRALIGYSKGDMQIPVEYESKNELGEMCDAIRRSQLILGEVIHDTSNLLSEMAAGNFDVKSKDEKLYVGELTTMFRSIREINHQLSDTLAHITLSADQVAAGSEQIANGAQSLAQGTTEQASAIQELSATFAEISNSAKKNAQGSAGAMEKTEYASSQLEESKKYMDDMVIAMKKISESSGEISNIIKSIEDIAFQTNILALNAAVEAARAGSAGKGFAVVANEVRDLANKSDQSAKATKVLIETSLAAVQDGDHFVSCVSESLKRTVDATEAVKESMHEVDESVRKEAEAIAQVMEGVEQISSVVQTNSATSEESAAASEELSSQASLIKELLSKFTLRSSDYETGSRPLYQGEEIFSNQEKREESFAKY